MEREDVKRKFIAICEKNVNWNSIDWNEYIQAKD